MGATRLGVGDANLPEPPRSTALDAGIDQRPLTGKPPLE